MNVALSDEQELLREAARGTLARVPTLAAARDALEGTEAPDLWPAAVEAGWPGLLVGEERGGAGLGPFEAMLVAQECGRVLAGVPLLGHLVASWLLDRGGHDATEAVAAGERRAAAVLAMPPTDLDDRWTWEPERGRARPAAGSDVASWVPDAPGADLLVVVGAGGAVTVVERPGVEPVVRYDATRPLGRVVLGAAGATALDVEAGDAARAWHLAQALLAAEAVGAMEALLELGVAYAKERFTFGRPIGSYQAVKHQLVEVLRVLDNARSLLLYAGWAADAKPGELALAAACARSAAGRGLDAATRIVINVHGGIGATWEHDAPLYFRRAQLARRLLGGTAGATDRVAGELLAAA